MPWDEPKETYAPQFSSTIGAPAKSMRMAFGALYIKQKLGLTDKETVHQIRENAYMQYFLRFAGYTVKAPFNASMMVLFRKHFSKEDLRRIDELVVQRGKEILLEVLAQTADDDQHVLLWNLAPRSAFQLIMAFRSCIASAGTPTTKEKT